MHYRFAGHRYPIPPSSLIYLAHIMRVFAQGAQWKTQSASHITGISNAEDKRALQASLHTALVFLVKSDIFQIEKSFSPLKMSMQTTISYAGGGNHFQGLEAALVALQPRQQRVERLITDLIPENTSSYDYVFQCHLKVFLEHGLFRYSRRLSPLDDGEDEVIVPVMLNLAELGWDCEQLEISLADYELQHAALAKSWLKEIQASLEHHHFA